MPSSLVANPLQARRALAVLLIWTLALAPTTASANVDRVSETRVAASEVGDHNSHQAEFDSHAALHRENRSTVQTSASDSSNYYHPDHLGSVNATTDSTGRLTSVTQHWPYGARRFEAGDPPLRGFAGAEAEHQRDVEREFGLLEFGARHYDPESGRFITPDNFLIEQPERCIKSPIECTSTYSYARNAPTVFTDPTGHETPVPQMDPERQKVAAVVMGGAAAAGVAVLGAEAATAAAPYVSQASITGGAWVYSQFQRLSDGVQRIGNALFSRFGGQSLTAPAPATTTQVQQATSALSPQSVLDGMSKNNLKHSITHLAEFQELDTSMTADRLRQLGASLVQDKNLISAPDAAQKAYQAVVTVGENSVVVRTVLNQLDKLHSVHIRY